jgi:hypothetical protein
VEELQQNDSFAAVGSALGSVMNLFPDGAEVNTLPSRSICVELIENLDRCHAVPSRDGLLRASQFVCDASLPRLTKKSGTERWNITRHVSPYSSSAPGSHSQ